MAPFNVVICHKEPESRPGVGEEGIYLCLVVYKIRKENTVVLKEWEYMVWFVICLSCMHSHSWDVQGWKKHSPQKYLLYCRKRLWGQLEGPTWEHLHHRCKNQHLCLFTALYTHVKTHPHTLAFGTDCFILSGTKCLVLLLCQLNRERLFCAHHEWLREHRSNVTEHHLAGVLHQQISRQKKTCVSVCVLYCQKWQ